MLFRIAHDAPKESAKAPNKQNTIFFPDKKAVSPDGATISSLSELVMLNEDQVSSEVLKVDINLPGAGCQVSQVERVLLY